MPARTPTITPATMKRCMVVLAAWLTALWNWGFKMLFPPGVGCGEINGGVLRSQNQQYVGPASLLHWMYNNLVANFVELVVLNGIE